MVTRSVPILIKLGRLHIFIYMQGMSGLNNGHHIMIVSMSFCRWVSWDHRTPSEMSSSDCQANYLQDSWLQPWSVRGGHMYPLTCIKCLVPGKFTAEKNKKSRLKVSFALGKPEGKTTLPSHAGAVWHRETRFLFFRA